MAEPFRIVDLGDRRVLETGGRQYPTRYSARVIRLLVERKGPRRAPLYFDFKETRGRHFLGPLFAYLRARGARGLARARGRLLVRPHDRVPRRAAGGRPRSPRSTPTRRSSS